MSHQQHQQLIDALQNCIVACNHCYDACLKEEDIKMMAECIRLDRECAEICSYLAQALCRDTPFAKELASVCANICEACGDECKNIAMRIVRNVRMPASNVQRHVKECLNA